ncbi:hypothetical protein JFK97_05635 [Chromobacterium phragmitis]|uniref:hypothetical protein n=1 Tax=Chromobacterium amazonense TaxID=1382803 RepID=UPI0021B751BB|nr:hypothetical protein [Chromobacterium amazonense]MBM2883865.1 hypothetical protein [Chromobacterium amazonense]MDE1716491.1 hypothetical protein [Chromobacterium amazonense]
MKQSIEYLQDAIEKLGVESDTKAAEALKISKQAICSYRSGERIMDDFTCIMVAKTLGIDGMEVIAAAQMEREKSEERREIWADFRKKFGVKMGIAGLAVAMTIGSLTPTKASAQTAEFDTIYSQKGAGGLYIMSNMLCPTRRR